MVQDFFSLFARVTCGAIAASTLVFAGCCAAVTPPAPTEAQRDSAALLGMWKVVAGNRAGEEFSAEKIKTEAAKLSFTENDQLAFIASGKAAFKTVAYVLNPAKQPKQIVLLPRPESGASEVNGIYRIEGDTLYLCTSYEGDKRFPAEFKGDAKTKTVLLTLRREKS